MLYNDLDGTELCRCGHAKIFHEPDPCNAVKAGKAPGYCNCRHFVPRGNALASKLKGDYPRPGPPFVDTRPPKVNQ